MRIYLFVTASFTLRDYERMGIEVLKDSSDVYIYDFASFFYPQTVSREESKSVICLEHYLFDNYSDINDAISTIPKGSLIIDYMSNGQMQDAIRLTVRNGGSQIIKVFATISPWRPRGSYFKSSASILKSRLLCFRNSAYLKLNYPNNLPVSMPDISIWCGGKCRMHPQARTQRRIMAHAFDFDLYLKEEQLRSSPVANGSYAVFIDQNLAVNHDKHISGMNPIVSHSNYFNSMNKFLEYLQDSLGLKVIISGHPKANKSHQSNFNFEQIYGSTPNLIKNSSLVITHYSAALSLAVLWKKPILLLTTDEINRSRVGNYPGDISRQLKRRLVNASTLHKQSVIREDLLIDDYSYDQYQDNYLKIKGTPQMGLWNIFANAIK